MAALLLDTAVLIDAERSGDVLDQIIADEDSVAISAITVAELRVGVLLATQRYRARRQAFADEILEIVPVVTYDDDIAGVHAELLAETQRSGRPRGAHDLIIAATARSTGRTIVTADAAGFDGLAGVKVAAYR